MTTTNFSSNSANDLLLRLASELLEVSVNPDMSLVANGLDSFVAKDLVVALAEHGYKADYESLLSDVSITSLAGCSQCPNLTSIGLWGCSLIKSVDPLVKCQQLKLVDCTEMVRSPLCWPKQRFVRR